MVHLARGMGKRRTEQRNRARPSEANNAWTTGEGTGSMYPHGTAGAKTVRAKTARKFGGIPIHIGEKASSKNHRGRFFASNPKDLISPFQGSANRRSWSLIGSIASCLARTQRSGRSRAPSSPAWLTLLINLCRKVGRPIQWDRPRNRRRRRGE